MNTITTILGALVLSLTAFVGSYFLSNNNQAVGSVASNEGYYSTTTDATFLVAPSYKVLRVGRGMFGSLIVTTTGSGVINVYDASTTINGGIYGTTTLAHITTSAAGTFTFDTNFNTGLLIETVGIDTGTTTITYK